MYFYDRNEKCLISLKESTNPNYRFSYKAAASKIETFSNSIGVIEPEEYNYWIDQILEGKVPPSTKPPKRGLKTPELGKTYLIGENLMKLEEIIPTRAAVFSLIKGENSNYQELTEEDANSLGIVWREGLIPFCPSIKLKEYNPGEVEFDSNNLSTYPRNTLGKYPNEINYIILSIDGFNRTTEEGIIEVPGGDILEDESFIVTLKVELKKDIPTIGSSAEFRAGDNLEFSIISGSFKGSRKLEEGDFIDTEGRIHLIVRLRNESHGVNALSLRDISPTDLFKISWDSAFAIGNKISQTMDIKNIINHNFAIFKKEKSGFLFRKVDPSTKRYIKLIQM